MDINSSPLIVALMAALAIPGVTSALAALVRRASDAIGIDPRVIVYASSLLITGALVATGTAALPAWTGDPASYVLAWLTWGVVNAEMARRVYELLMQRGQAAA